MWTAHGNGTILTAKFFQTENYIITERKICAERIRQIRFSCWYDSYVLQFSNEILFRNISSHFLAQDRIEICLHQFWNIERICYLQWLDSFIATYNQCLISLQIPTIIIRICQTSSIIHSKLFCLSYNTMGTCFRICQFRDYQRYAFFDHLL